MSERDGAVARAFRGSKARGMRSMLPGILRSARFRDIEVPTPFIGHIFGDVRVIQQWFAESILQPSGFDPKRGFTQPGKFALAVLKMVAALARDMQGAMVARRTRDGVASIDRGPPTTGSTSVFFPSPAAGIRQPPSGESDAKNEKGAAGAAPFSPPQKEVGLGLFRRRSAFPS